MSTFLYTFYMDFIYPYFYATADFFYDDWEIIRFEFYPDFIRYVLIPIYTFSIGEILPYFVYAIHFCRYGIHDYIVFSFLSPYKDYFPISYLIIFLNFINKYFNVGVELVRYFVVEVSYPETLKDLKMYYVNHQAWTYAYLLTGWGALYDYLYKDFYINYSLEYIRAFKSFPSDFVFKELFEEFVFHQPFKTLFIILFLIGLAHYIHLRSKRIIKFLLYSRYFTFKPKPDSNLKKNAFTFEVRLLNLGLYDIYYKLVRKGIEPFFLTRNIKGYDHQGIRLKNYFPIHFYFFMRDVLNYNLSRKSFFVFLAIRHHNNIKKIYDLAHREWWDQAVAKSQIITEDEIDPRLFMTPFPTGYEFTGPLYRRLSRFDTAIAPLYARIFIYLFRLCIILRTLFFWPIALFVFRPIFVYIVYPTYLKLSGWYFKIHITYLYFKLKPKQLLASTPILFFGYFKRFIILYRLFYPVHISIFYIYNCIRQYLIIEFPIYKKVSYPIHKLFYNRIVHPFFYFVFDFRHLKYFLFDLYACRLENLAQKILILFGKIVRFFFQLLFSLFINFTYIPIWTMNCFKFIVRKLLVLRFRSNIIKFGAIAIIPFYAIHIIYSGLFPFIYPSFGLNMLSFISKGFYFFMDNPNLLTNFGAHYSIDTTPASFYQVFIFLALSTVLLFFLIVPYLFYVTNYVPLITRTNSRKETDPKKIVEELEEEEDVLDREEETTVKRFYEPLFIFSLFVFIILLYTAIEYHLVHVRFTFRMWPYWLDLTPWSYLENFDNDYLDEQTAQNSNWKFIDTIRYMYFGGTWFRKQYWSQIPPKRGFKRVTWFRTYYKRKKKVKNFYRVWVWKFRKEGRMRYFFRGLVSNRPLFDFFRGIRYYFKRVIPKAYRKTYRKHFKEGGIFIRWLNRVAFYLFLKPLFLLKENYPKFYYKHHDYIRPFVKFIAYIFLIRGEEKVDRGTRHEYPPINAEDPETKKRLEEFFKWLEKNKF